MRLDCNSLLAENFGWTGKAIKALGLILNSGWKVPIRSRLKRERDPKFLLQVQDKSPPPPPPPPPRLRNKIKDQDFRNEIYIHCRTIKQVTLKLSHHIHLIRGLQITPKTALTIDLQGDREGINYHVENLVIIRN